MTTFPTTDSECTKLGWIEYYVDAASNDLHVSISLDSDLDSRVFAFCHDGQEMITIQGWNVTFERVN